MPDERDDDHRPPTRTPAEGVRIIGAEEAASRLEAGQAAGRRPGDAPRFGDVPPQPSGPRPQVRFPLPDDAERRPAVSPATSDLPHWSDPPTGEVPRILASDGTDDGDDDLEAWASLASRAPRWRDQEADWAEADFEDPSILGDDEARLGALDESRSERSDLFSFDEDIDDEEEEVAAPRMTQIRTRPSEPPELSGTAPGGGDRDLPVAIATGIAVSALALFCFWQGPGWTAALATAVVVLCGAELFDVFRRAGYRPATLLGLVATGALMVGTFARGERAVPLVLALTVIFAMLWYLGGVVRARPTVNLAVTFLGFFWVGFLGCFATLMLRYPNDEGIAFLVGTVVATVANDIGALFAGRQWGRTPLAPTISPAKTWEGFAGGAIVSIVVCGMIVSRMSPWGFGTSLLLALVVSAIAPVGDLCESMIKRDLGVKDMGSVLPGHGGALDRFDAILFALPAVYYLVELLDLPT